MQKQAHLFSLQGGRTESNAICKSFLHISWMRVIQSQYLVHPYISQVYTASKDSSRHRDAPSTSTPDSSPPSYLTHFYCVRLPLENQVTSDGPFAQISLAAIATLRKPRSPW